MRIWPTLKLNFANNTDACAVCVLSCSVMPNSLRPHRLWPAGCFVHGILQARTHRSGFPFPTPGDRSYDSTWILPPRFVIKMECVCGMCVCGMGWRKLASCSDPADPLMGGRHCSQLGAGGWQEPHSQGPYPTTVFNQDGLNRWGYFLDWKGHSFFFFLFGCISWHAGSPGPGTKPQPPPGEAWHLNHRTTREAQKGPSWCSVKRATQGPNL